MIVFDISMLQFVFFYIKRVYKYEIRKDMYFIYKIMFYRVRISVMKKVNIILNYLIGNIVLFIVC